MSDSLLNIIISTVKKGHGDKETLTGVRKLNAGLKELTGLSLVSVTALGAAGAAVGGLAKFLKDSVDQTVKYATEVDNLSRLLGISTEDTSRLIQASDDLFISQEKLQAGLQAATRQGIDVSIEGLKKLADEYKGMPEGVERSEWVLKNFGRSGAEMGKLMEIGAAGIDEATAAIADNMIITGKSYEEIMNYKRSVDELQDSWQGVKYTVGGLVIPTLTDFITFLNEATGGTMRFSQAAANWLNKIYEGTVLESEAGKEARHAREQIEGFNLMLKDSRNAGYVFDDGMRVVNTSLFGLSEIITPVTAYFSDLTTEMLYNKAAAGLDADASMALAESMGLIDGETAIVLDKLGQLRSDLDTGKITLEEYTERVKILNENMALIQSKTVTLTVRTSLDDQLGLWGQGPHNAYIGLAEGNRALGGPVMGNTPYIVGERGPELFVPNSSGKIVPNNELGGGNNITIHVNGAGDPMLVANEVMRRLRLQTGTR
jgi:hypothetical protein